MMMAGPPCYTSHTPKRLDKFAAEALSWCMLRSGISNTYRSYLNLYNSEHSSPFYDAEVNVDRVITASPTSTLSEERDQLLFRLVSVKRWWDRDDVFGASNSAWRRLIQEAMQHLFDQMDCFFKSPILMLTLQVCYSWQAGYFNKPFVQLSLQLPRCSCKAYAKFLDALAPFGIRSLSDTSIIFGSPEPLGVIVRNSIGLKVVHFRNNSSDFIIEQVGKNCPSVHTFIVEDLFGTPMVSQDYLYRTFFKGATKDDIIKSIDNKEDITLSFPHLKCLDVGKSNQILDFIFHTQYYHGNNIKSISCNSSNFNVETTFLNIPNSLLERNISFSITDLFLASSNLNTMDISRITKIFNKVGHISFTVDILPLDTEQQAIDNCITMMQCLSVTSITVYVQYHSEETDVLTRVYSAIFNVIGKQLRALQFQILRSMDWSFIVTLVNLCPNIHLLGLNIFVDISLSDVSRPAVMFSPLVHLQHLSIFYEENTLLASFLERIERIIMQSAKLETLELFLPHTACTWIMTIAANGYIASVEKLILGLQYVVYMLQPDIDLYVPVVEALTNLKILVLVKVPDVILSHMKKIFNSSSLLIKSDSCSSIGYLGFFSMHKV